MYILITSLLCVLSANARYLSCACCEQYTRVSQLERGGKGRQFRQNQSDKNTRTHMTASAPTHPRTHRNDSDDTRHPHDANQPHDRPTAHFSHPNFFNFLVFNFKKPESDRVFSRREQTEATHSSSESLIRFAYPSRSSESLIRVAHPSQSRRPRPAVQRDPRGSRATTRISDSDKRLG